MHSFCLSIAQDVIAMRKSFCLASESQEKKVTTKLRRPQHFVRPVISEHVLLAKESKYLQKLRNY